MPKNGRPKEASSTDEQRATEYLRKVFGPNVDEFISRLSCIANIDWGDRNSLEQAARDAMSFREYNIDGKWRGGSADCPSYEAIRPLKVRRVPAPSEHVPGQKGTSIVLLLDDECDGDVEAMLRSCERIASHYQQLQLEPNCAIPVDPGLLKKKCEVFVATRVPRFTHLVSERLHWLLPRVVVLQETLTDGKNSLLSKCAVLLRSVRPAVFLDKELDWGEADYIFQVIQSRTHGCPGWRGEGVILGRRDKQTGLRHVGIVTSVETYLDLLGNIDFDVEVVREGWFGRFVRNPRSTEPYLLNDVLLWMKYWSNKNGWGVGELPFS